MAMALASKRKERRVEGGIAAPARRDFLFALEIGGC